VGLLDMVASGVEAECRMGWTLRLRLRLRLAKVTDSSVPDLL